MKEIYLDNGATTKPSKGVIAKMTEAMADAYGNPSSLHRKGQQAEGYVTKARRILAEYMKVDPTTLYFKASIRLSGPPLVRENVWDVIS